MLAKTARVTTADDYRAAVRRGARFTGPNTVTYVRRDLGAPSADADADADAGAVTGAQPRFGFIVSKAVGVAVIRNRVRRRLKAVCYSLQSTVEPGTEIVIRALPGSATSSYASLQSEVVRSFTKARVLT